MFANGVFLRPGQELRDFDVLRADTHSTGGGRVLRNSQEKLGTTKAILAAAKPEEIERWRILSHKVTHKIIQQGVLPFEVKPGDVFERGEKRYCVQTEPYNVGDINHWTIYYCEERGDV